MYLPSAEHWRVKGPTKGTYTAHKASSKATRLFLMKYKQHQSLAKQGVTPGDWRAIPGYVHRHRHPVTLRTSFRRRVGKARTFSSIFFRLYTKKFDFYRGMKIIYYIMFPIFSRRCGSLSSQCVSGRVLQLPGDCDVATIDSKRTEPG